MTFNFTFNFAAFLFFRENNDFRFYQKRPAKLKLILKSFGLVR